MTSMELNLKMEPLEYRVSFDSAGNPLKGKKNYTLLIPSNIPEGIMWSIIVYDSQTDLMITTGQLWPSVYRSCKGLEVNTDGSVDTWFGPEAPKGKEHNWIQTMPGKNWYMILRLYNPFENWIKGLWSPCKIELID
jgi:hypothetical protein